MITGKEDRFYYNQEIISLIRENCLGFFRDSFDHVLKLFCISKHYIGIEGSSIFDDEIIKRIEKFIKKYPEQRFLQLLINIGLVRDSTEEWHEESETTYYRLWKLLNQSE